VLAGTSWAPSSALEEQVGRQARCQPLPFIYESTGTETRFTNGYDPEARSRRVFTFHRPQTLAEWARQITEDPAVPTFRGRLKAMPPLDERGLWGKQAEAIRNIERSLAEDRPRADPDGHRVRENVHGRDSVLPADQVCRGAADLVPGRPVEPGRAGQAGVQQVHHRRDPAEVPRRVQHPAPDHEHDRHGSASPRSSGSSPSSKATRNWTPNSTRSRATSCRPPSGPRSPTARRCRRTRSPSSATWSPRCSGACASRPLASTMRVMTGSTSSRPEFLALENTGE